MTREQVEGTGPGCSRNGGRLCWYGVRDFRGWLQIVEGDRSPAQLLAGFIWIGDVGEDGQLLDVGRDDELIVHHIVLSGLDDQIAPQNSLFGHRKQAGH